MKGGRVYAVTADQVINDFVTTDVHNIAAALALSPNHVVVFRYLPASPGPPPVPAGIADDGSTFDRSLAAHIDPAIGLASGGHNVEFGEGTSIVNPANYARLRNPAHRLFVYITGGVHPAVNRRIINEVVGFSTIAQLNQWLLAQPNAGQPPPPPAAPPAPPAAPAAPALPVGLGPLNAFVLAARQPLLARYPGAVLNHVTGELRADIPGLIDAMSIFARFGAPGGGMTNPIMSMLGRAKVAANIIRPILRGPGYPGPFVVPDRMLYNMITWLTIKIVNGQDDIPEDWLTFGRSLQLITPRPFLNGESIASSFEATVREVYQGALDSNDGSGIIEAGRELERMLMNLPAPGAGAAGAPPPPPPPPGPPPGPAYGMGGPAPMNIVPNNNPPNMPPPPPPAAGAPFNWANYGPGGNAGVLPPGGPGAPAPGQFRWGNYGPRRRNGGSTRRSSLPKRKAGRSSSARKRNYSRRTRA